MKDTGCNNASVLGIDIGSISLSLAQIGKDGTLLKTAYLFHHGKIREALMNSLTAIDLSVLSGIACTSASPDIINGAVRFDSQLALMAGTRHFYKKVGSILQVGGEKFSLLEFDDNGNYRGTMTNSSCAAGTGSFLDQQARRLNLGGVEKLCEMASSNRGNIPKIASRCAVFAKTDLIHAQQEGYRIEEICDGLCFGLAENIVDALFVEEETHTPLVFTGGVSRNLPVVRHIESLIRTDLMVHKYSHIFPAVGVCCLARESGTFPSISLDVEELVKGETKVKTYFYPSLELRLSDYPDFSSEESYLFNPSKFNPLEVDLYAHLEHGLIYDVFMGIDIGSTSTKAVIIGEDRRILAGFYTYTAGKPLQAVQAIFEALGDVIKRKKIELRFHGVSTTGSGRKFVGEIVGADLVLDEITAHARAAFELNPEIDTIIEIGGQDSKFTIMRNGMVTFSQMNAVCAAGTGSFIEEQAVRLNCPLDEYSARAEGEKAPLASDRCTVFMERDINHYLNRGYNVNEILAAALFSVRENYLRRVAVEGMIGEKVCFQGATAKNRALVAAFEQRLGKPIFVSKYCHLTGAIGAAILVSEEVTGASRFRGLSLCDEDIPIRVEQCELCSNHCRLRIADVQGESVAYGFLCGRDYKTKEYVSRNRSGFDLLAARRLQQTAGCFDGASRSTTGSIPRITIGIPSALYLREEQPLWRRFFSNLGIQTEISSLKEPVKAGKRLTGAEFCAPITAMHAHAVYLAERVDYLFLPMLVRSSEQMGEQGKYYCYYSQFSSSLVAALDRKGLKEKCLLPAIDRFFGLGRTVHALWDSLRFIAPKKIRLQEVHRAYEEALEFFEENKKGLRKLFLEEYESAGGISVVLLGRPYTVLSPAMNKGIPDIFASLGVKAFFQDMLPADLINEKEDEDISSLLSVIHWHYAAKIVEAARITAGMERLYPVLVTSFKCSPDAFVIEYFKRILDHWGKPYLILQLDEHESRVGYETRIESAVRAFRNHDKNRRILHRGRMLPINPTIEKTLKGKVMLFPNWDAVTCPLMVANLQRHGFDARLLPENEEVIKKSMRHNTGQCIPLNVITQEFVDYIKSRELDPAKTVLWVPKADISCNITAFPYYIKSCLEALGGGFEKAGVFAGLLIQWDISLSVCLHAYIAALLGGLLKRLSCRIRPYETEPGETDRVLSAGVTLLSRSFKGESPLEETLKEVISSFDRIPKEMGERPKVAIFGDLYVRDNDVMNQGLVHTIEDAGGEVITTPLNEFLKIMSGFHFKRWYDYGQYVHLAKTKALLLAVQQLDRRYYHYFEKYLGPLSDFHLQHLEEKLAKFNLSYYHAGESVENILKIFHIIENHPDVALFVQASPAFCCPSLVTEAMKKDIERVTGVPVVTITYDGAGGIKNEVIVPYLRH